MNKLKLLTACTFLGVLCQSAYAGGPGIPSPEMPSSYGGLYVGAGGSINFIQAE